MNEIFEKIYNDNNTDLNESSALFEKVYTEAEMLNEMNPKLRALLAAGLIGTASLGAASCSMPTDDPTGYEQPAPETPSNPDNPDDPGDNGGEELTEEQRWAQTPFGQLGVTREDAERIANASLHNNESFTLNPEFIEDNFDECIIYLYINSEFKAITDVTSLTSDYNNGVIRFECYSNGKFYEYIVPSIKADAFFDAKAAYNN